MSDPPSPAPRTRRRWLKRLLVLIGVVYLVIVLLMLSFENKLIFFPSTDADYWLPPPDPHITDVQFTSTDGTALHGWYFAEPGADQALLYCHGNGGNVSDRGQILLGFAQACHAAAFVFDYPGYGKCPGRPTEAGCYAAADAAYDWLVNEKKFPPGRILLLGESLGGGVAVELARRHDHRALILLDTFTSLPDVGRFHYPWIPVRWLMSNRFDNLSKIGDCHRPVFIAHGTADSVVPFVLAERLFAAANEPKRFVPVTGGVHNSPVSAECLDAMQRFVKELPP